MRDLKDFFKNKKVVITGHTGFKGSWLSIWLTMLGAEVYGYAKNIPTSPSMFQLTRLDQHVKTFYGDIFDTQNLKLIINKVKPDIIFHLAAQPIVGLSYTDPVATFQTNIMGTASILEVLRTLDYPCSLINISSDKSYLNKEWIWGYRENDELGGKDPYSASKAGAEIVFNSFFHSYFSSDSNKKIATARAGNVIGGGDWGKGRLIPDCINAWNNNHAVKVKNPESIRPWQHVLDATYGYLLLAQKLHENPVLNGEAFNFGPQKTGFENVINVVEMLANEIKKRGFNADVIIENNTAFSESKILKLNCDKAFSLLKWQPKSDINESVTLTAEWYTTKITNESDLLELTQQQISDYQNKLPN
jgi:CDP-glucose 4,6-dehydratase